MLLFLDIETQNTFEDVGPNNLAGLKVSYVGVIDDKGEEYDFWEQDLPALGEMMKKADMTIHYNGFHFDMPVLANYLGPDVLNLPQIDLMVAAQKSLGFRPKLDMLTDATLGYGKTGDGLDAIKYWVAGELDKLKEYCLMDVKITKELYEFGLNNEYIRYFDKAGFLRKTEIDWEVGKRVVEEKAEDQFLQMF